MTDLMVVGPSVSAEVGAKLLIDRFVSKERALEPLARGGKLYMITLRPPPEKIWLIAVLDQPTFDGTQWIAPASEIPITDITALRSKLRFASGEGWTDWCDGCQQTHWYRDIKQLSPDDVALLDAAVGRSADTARTPEPISTGSGKRHGALLDAVVENPTSDDARRVYADQLLADNDLRGEFILIDIALAGRLSMRNRARLAARRAHLLAGYASTWWPYALKRRETQKGFLRAVHGTWAQLSAASELFACEPVTVVGIQKLDGDGLTELLAAPWLPRLYRLIAHGLEGDGFSRLATAPQLATLRALDVSNNDLGPGALATLDLPAVENLVLTGNPIGDAGLLRLAGWKQLANVHTLYLSNCEIEELDAFLGAADLRNLSMLTLSFNSLGDSGVSAFATHAPRLPALEHLELKDCGLSSSGVEAILAANLPSLRRLDVRRNRRVDASPARDPRIRV